MGEEEAELAPGERVPTQFYPETGQERLRLFDRWYILSHGRCEGPQNHMQVDAAEGHVSRTALRSGEESTGCVSRL
jgi:hypothetical protein